jgi:hypothetical protein
LGKRETFMGGRRGEKLDLCSVEKAKVSYTDFSEEKI